MVFEDKADLALDNSLEVSRSNISDDVVVCSKFDVVLYGLMLIRVPDIALTVAFENIIWFTINIAQNSNTPKVTINFFVASGW